MRFSIYMNPQTRGPEQDVEVLEDNIRQVRRVNDAGFAGVVLTEHHFSEYNTYGYNVQMAAYLAGLLQPGTRFLLAAVIPPLHDPMRLAQELNLLDIVTRGNAIVGLGSGGSPVEFAGLGRLPKDRYEDLGQTVDVMKRAMLKDKADPPLVWRTRYGGGTLYTRLMPTAYHRAMPPFAKAVMNDEAARDAGEEGLYLFSGRTTLEETVRRQEMYQEGLRRSRLEPEEIEDRLDWSFVQKQVIVAGSDDEARSEAFSRIRLLNEFHAGLQARMQGVEQADQLKTLATLADTERETFFKKAFIAGTPETVRAEFQRYANAGVRHMALWFHFGFMTAVEADRSLDLFLNEVYPKLAPEGEK
ncbi:MULTISPECIES: LLM class flavin-dependent oxidoreductase [Streptomyces]|uniref:LLM class flavin-dependent oxidoreductase n=1 Tax=Streptomyces lycopersici TaxID=2974589 RepID=UPI0021D0D862|nr:LLM class flavin-dependent oxidoreductase [Streptomyces sp. NEAU-383]